MKKLFCAFVLVLLTSACTSVTVVSPLTTPTRSSPAATQLPAVTVVPTAAVENLLAQQLSKDLSAHPRPVCELGTHNENDWAGYEQQLALALGKLFADPRGQSLASHSLIGVFEQVTGLSLDAVEGTGDALLITIVKANCNNRTGGGASPAAHRDLMLVLNRHGDTWQVGMVTNVLNAEWATDHWIVLVTATDFGGGSGFEVRNVIQSAGQWKSETKFQFTQTASLPLPRMSAEGTALTLYAPPAACNLPKNIPDPNPWIESDYKLQGGQYQCVSSRLIPTPVPTKSP